MTESCGVPLMVGGALGATTVIENGAIEVLACPSVTLTTMPEYWPAWDGAGVPRRAPVAVSKLAQPGMPLDPELQLLAIRVGSRRLEQVRLARVHRQGRDAPDVGRVVGFSRDRDAERRERDLVGAVRDRDRDVRVAAGSADGRDAAQQTGGARERGPVGLVHDRERQRLAFRVLRRGHEAVERVLENGRRPGCRRWWARRSASGSR